MTAEVATQRRSRTRLSADQRRTQLLTQAARLFMERGYAGVGIDELGAAVGISGPAVYRHVSGKEQLITEIAAGWLDLLAARTESVIALTADSDAAARLDALLGAALDIASANVAEVTVVARYTDIATRPFGPPADSASETASGDASVPSGMRWARWQTVVEHWAPVLRANHPHLEPAQASDYMRLVTGLVLGAASCERDISQAARVSLLAQASSRVLETPLDLSARDSLDASSPSQASWRRASRREQILDTAVRMFRERGYGGVSMADIAEAVGVTPSASYRHFTSKEELLATAVERAGDRMVLSLGTALAAAVTAEDAIDSLIRTLVRDSLTNRDSIAVSVTERFHLSPAQQAATRKRERLLVDEWTHALAATRPELSLAGREMLAQAVHRMVVEAALHVPHGAHDRAADTLTRACHAVVDAAEPSRT